jgi:hypothetical protein
LHRLNVDIAFPGHLRAIGNAGPNIGFFQTRVIVEDILKAPAASQEVQDQ